MAKMKFTYNGVEIEVDSDSRLAKQLENAASEAQEAETQLVRDSEYEKIKKYLLETMTPEVIKTLNGYSLVVNFDSGRLGSKELSGILLTKRVKLLQRDPKDAGNSSA